MSNITKHSAIQMALLLNAPGELRTYLVCLLNSAYGQDIILDLETLCHRLESISTNDDSENLVALLHYMFCLRIDNLDVKPS